MKFKVLYDTQISTKLYKKGDEVEFIQGTDELFIKRLIDINCIEPIAEQDKPKLTDKRGAKKPKEQPKDADDLGIDLDEIEE